MENHRPKPFGRSCVAMVLYLLLRSVAGAVSLDGVGAIRAPQISTPDTAVALTQKTLAVLLNEAPLAGAKGYYSAFSQSVALPDGRSVDMDSMKIVQTPDSANPYLAVFHSIDQANSQLFNTYLATSPDLKTWSTLGQIHHAAGMPDLRILPDGTALLAEESNPTAVRPTINLTFYKNTAAGLGFMRLIRAPATSDGTESFGLETPGALADGTPELSSIAYVHSIKQSKIFLTRHVWRSAETADSEALGVVTDFASFQDLGADAKLNQAVSSAGGIGQVGGRTIFQVGASVFELVEANTTPNDFGTWSIYLAQRDANLGIASITKLKPKLKGGATSMGNPHLSFVSLPNGHRGVAFTKFVFSQNSGSTPSGNRLVVVDLGGAALDSALVFDSKWYLGKYPDLAKAFGTNVVAATKHWMTNGIGEGRDGNAKFSVKSWLASSPARTAKYQANYLRALKDYISGAGG